MHHIIHVSQMYEVKYIGTFTKQLNKGVGQYFFQIAAFGYQPIKKCGDAYWQQIIIGEDAKRIVQTCRPASGDSQPGHNGHASKNGNETDISITYLISTLQPFFANKKSQLYPYKKFKTAPEISIQHHKGEITEEPIPVHVTE